MRKFSRFDETRRARWSPLIFSMCAWLSNRANWVWQRVAFAELCQDFTPSYKVSIFIIDCLVTHQFSDFFYLKSYSAALELFGIKRTCLVRHKSATWIDRTLNLICQTQISNMVSTDLIQTTSGIAQIFQNPVKNNNKCSVIV